MSLETVNWHEKLTKCIVILHEVVFLKVKWYLDIITANWTYANNYRASLISFQKQRFSLNIIRLLLVLFSKLRPTCANGVFIELFYRKLQQAHWSSTSWSSLKLDPYSATLKDNLTAKNRGVSYLFIIYLPELSVKIHLRKVFTFGWTH